MPDTKYVWVVSSTDSRRPPVVDRFEFLSDTPAGGVRVQARGRVHTIRKVSYNTIFKDEVAVRQYLDKHIQRAQALLAEDLRRIQSFAATLAAGTYYHATPSALPEIEKGPPRLD